MTRERRQHPNNTTPLYRAAVLRGASPGAIHALIAWFFEHLEEAVIQGSGGIGHGVGPAW